MHKFCNIKRDLNELITFYSPWNYRKIIDFLMILEETKVS